MPFQSSETAPRAMLDTPYLTPTTSFSDTNKSRQRVVSMPPREKVERRRLRRRQRWSDSPSLFDHKSTPNFFDETSTIFLRSNSTCSADSRDSEAWMAGGGLYTVPTINESSDEGSCDPFSSASDAQSVFLDSLQDDSALDTPKRDSFLSFTSNRSTTTLFRRV